MISLCFVKYADNKYISQAIPADPARFYWQFKLQTGFYR